MCWSPVATGIFGSIYIIGAIGILITRPRNYVISLAFLSFYMLMEWFQFIQWIWGDVTVTANETSLLSACSAINEGFTYFAWMLIWFQPFLFSVMGIYAHRHAPMTGKKKTFVYLSIVNFIVFLYSVISLAFANITSSTVVDYGYGAILNSNVGIRTCTFIGRNHHLHWMFRGIHPDYQLNNLMYVILCIISFVHYDWDIFGIPLSWTLTFFVTIICFQTSLAELPAFWCMMSICSLVINFVYMWAYHMATRRSADKKQTV